MEKLPTRRSRAQDLCAPARSRQDSEDLVDYTVSMRGVEVGMLFIEQARGGVKVSFRARNGLDCARLAAQFGGGGHRAAAGATVPGAMAEIVDRVLSAVRQALDPATVAAQGYAQLAPVARPGRFRKHSLDSTVRPG